MFKNKKAVGIEAVKDNRKIKFYVNKDVILSAGAINSPTLLMLSGIGPRKHLTDLNVSYYIYRYAPDFVNYKRK